MVESANCFTMPSAEALAMRSGVDRWHLSLTHTDRVAVAMVVAEGGLGGGVVASGGPTPMPADLPPKP